MSNTISSAEIIKILEKNGFTKKSQKGSHVKYVYLSKIVIVPHPKKNIPIGTLSSIIRQSGINKKDFN